MEIRMYVRTCIPYRPPIISHDHCLNLGKYNEFYLPSLGSRDDVMVVVTDDEGRETTLHLKR